MINITSCKKKAFTLSLYVAAVLIALFVFGCGTNPTIEVESYDELKQEFGNQSIFLFPDTASLSAYQIIYSFESWTEGSGCSSQRIPRRYNLYATNQQPKVTSVFNEIDIQADDHDYRVSKQETEEYHPIAPNTVYRKVEVQESCITKKDISYAEAYGVSPDSTFMQVVLSFEFEQCDYHVTGRMVLTPEESESIDAKEMLQRGKQELYSLVDSILDQKLP